MRSLLALLLALGLHLLLFQMIIPLRETLLPQITGNSQVTVSLVGPPPQLPLVVEEKPGPEYTIRPQAESDPPAYPAVGLAEKDSPARQVVPEKNRKSISEKQGGSDDSVPSRLLPAVTRKPAGGKGLGSRPVPAKEAGTSGAASVPATLRQAMPLAAANRPPDYPALARKRGWEGKVLLEVEVHSDGTVQAVRVKTGSDHALLDQAALHAVQKWRFQPGSKGEEPVAMTVLVPVHFVLKDHP